MKPPNRIRIFVVLSTICFLVCIVRLMQIQIVSKSYYREKVDELKLRSGLHKQLKTLRGRILDRNGTVLAVDEPRFQVQINYRLCSIMDERVRRAMLLNAEGKEDSAVQLPKIRNEIEAKLDKLQQIIDKCSYFGIEREKIETKIKKTNNRIWNIRRFQAWRKNCTTSKLLKKYKNNLADIRQSELISDFEKEIPDYEKRLQLIRRIKITEMYRNWPLFELKTDDDIFTAQLEFMNTENICILPKAQRFYPFGPTAAQTIGWVGPPQESDRKSFEDDRLSRYLADEVCGREDGVEYVCEAILRGKRGELRYDIDRQLVSRTDITVGRDISLTLDIQLQQNIEKQITNPSFNTNSTLPTAAVVIDVKTADILVLTSLPSYEIGAIRQDYSVYAKDPGRPLLNRAINKQYPPGSIIKPVILVAGFETGRITAEQTISCPAQRAPKGWPNCWIFKRLGKCHDDKWYDQGGNTAHNAIRGSCNIYFSRLANRINPAVLQKWLWDFGCGREILSPPSQVRSSTLSRNFRQTHGQISNTPMSKPVSDFNDVPMLTKTERRFFGIGQGNLRVTVLQVANVMATIARDGLFSKPALFIDDSNDSNHKPVSLNIRTHTLNVVKGGLKAVVNEPGGTAYSAFNGSDFDRQSVTVYGKTGSTEKPYNAWFAGFAEDNNGRCIAVALIIEGGQHGSSDAAPIAQEIIQQCITAGYIGQKIEE